MSEPIDCTRPRSSRSTTPELPPAEEALGQLTQRSLSGTSFPGTPSKCQTVWTPRLTPKRLRPASASSCIANAIRASQPHIAIQRLAPGGTPVPQSMLPTLRAVLNHRAFAFFFAARARGYYASATAAELDSVYTASVAVVTQYYPIEPDRQIAAEIYANNRPLGDTTQLPKLPGALLPYLHMSSHDLDADLRVPYLYRRLLTMNTPAEWEAVVRESLVLFEEHAMLAELWSTVLAAPAHDAFVTPAWTAVIAAPDHRLVLLFQKADLDNNRILLQLGRIAVATGCPFYVLWYTRYRDLPLPSYLALTTIEGLDKVLCFCAYLDPSQDRWADEVYMDPVTPGDREKLSDIGVFVRNSVHGTNPYVSLCPLDRRTWDGRKMDLLATCRRFGPAVRNTIAVPPSYEKLMEMFVLPETDADWHTCIDELGRFLMNTWHFRQYVEKLPW
ncbi:hypothetical protein SARC_00102 [Sphaeroforma arctica JP610]|uniref:Uncharacterized protein n=1 Tax=Sphaeroforma arctica JP610 TaxID=667725 RepID=A0A0L0GFJ0_9EUKA|nr:hypothetical protein SARC_00102 [Sphaeroforma arctica JP610]KNC87845.1 hypothetical protein SARC_00102 [Sphaeroforma arctica JP610]|eukprot:XP_014161747.1 hypothetical protein SARC_00102 [Sphaeroforma arctica JP610]